MIHRNIRIGNIPDRKSVVGIEICHWKSLYWSCSNALNRRDVALLTDIPFWVGYSENSKGTTDVDFFCRKSILYWWHPVTNPLLILKIFLLLFFIIIGCTRDTIHIFVIAHSLIIHRRLKAVVPYRYWVPTMLRIFASYWLCLDDKTKNLLTISDKFLSITTLVQNLQMELAPKYYVYLFHEIDDDHQKANCIGRLNFCSSFNSLSHYHSIQSESNRLLSNKLLIWWNLLLSIIKNQLTGVLLHRKEYNLYHPLTIATIRPSTFFRIKSLGDRCYFWGNILPPLPYNLRFCGVIWLKEDHPALLKDNNINFVYTTLCNANFYPITLEKYAFWAMPSLVLVIKTIRLMPSTSFHLFSISRPFWPVIWLLHSLLLRNVFLFVVSVHLEASSSKFIFYKASAPLTIKLLPTSTWVKGIICSSRKNWGIKCSERITQRNTTLCTCRRVFLNIGSQWR